MKHIVNMPHGNAYEVDDNGTIINIQTGKKVSRIWAYPVKQAVWGGVPNIHYFATLAARNAYMEGHDYCDKLQRCKVMSDMIDTVD